jgi:hypothetical protein
MLILLRHVSCRLKRINHPTLACTAIRLALTLLCMQIEQDWIAPMMPVIYPEDCTPGSWQEVQPACDRATKWVGGVAPPPGVADIAKRDSFCIQVRLEHAWRACCGWLHADVQRPAAPHELLLP